MALAAEITRQGRRGRPGPRALAQKAHKQAIKEHLADGVCAPVFEAYHTVKGTWELPSVAEENQSDGVRTGWKEVDMMAISETIKKQVKKRDKLFTDAPPRSSASLADPGLPPAPGKRAQVFVLKKWLMPFGKTTASRDDHKVINERLVEAVWEHYGARDLLQLFAEARARKLNCHDLADAFGLAMAEALRQYAAHTKTVLPRRRPRERRSDTPELTPAQLGADPDGPGIGGTIRVVGIDPGKRNLGLCVVELAGMRRPPRPANDPTSEADADAIDEPEPVFRVLSLQLIDLQAPAGAHAVLHYAAPPGPPVYYEPAHAPDQPMVDVFTVGKRSVEATLALLEGQRAVAEARKAAREAKRNREEKEEEEDSTPAPREKETLPLRPRKRAAAPAAQAREDVEPLLPSPKRRRLLTLAEVAAGGTVLDLTREDILL